MLALRSLLSFLVHLYVVSMREKINNGDKFYRRNFMQVADEKLIINKVGPSARKSIPKFSSTLMRITHTSNISRLLSCAACVLIFFLFFFFWGGTIAQGWADGTDVVLVAW